MPDVKNFLWLIGLALLVPVCARAQVKVNPAALQQLQGLPPIPAPTQPVVDRPTLPPALRHHTHPRHSAPRAKPELPAPEKAPTLPAPKKAPAAPAPAPKSMPMPVPVPTPAPHPTPNVTLHAPVLPPVVKIAFSPDSAILPADAKDALRPYCASKSRIPIVAHAPVNSTNPGMAMQLSMERAFAVRAALIACGVPAQNIIPQSTGGTTDANSNDVLIGARLKP